MKPLCRREFLMVSAVAGAASDDSVQPLITAVPTAQPGAALAPAQLATGALDADSVEKIEKVVAYTMKSSKVPGLAIGVVKEGKLVFAKGYGVAQQGEQRLVTPQTLFRVMDLTHLFTAAAAVLLAEQGKLDLDTPIVEVLPYFELQGEQLQTDHDASLAQRDRRLAAHTGADAVQRLGRQNTPVRRRGAGALCPQFERRQDRQ